MEVLKFLFGEEPFVLIFSMLPITFIALLMTWVFALPSRKLFPESWTYVWGPLRNTNSCAHAAFTPKHERKLKGNPRFVKRCCVDSLYVLLRMSVACLTLFFFFAYPFRNIPAETWRGIAVGENRSDILTSLSSDYELFFDALFPMFQEPVTMWSFIFLCICEGVAISMILGPVHRINIAPFHDGVRLKYVDSIVMKMQMDFDIIKLFFFGFLSDYLIKRHLEIALSNIDLLWTPLPVFADYGTIFSMALIIVVWMGFLDKTIIKADGKTLINTGVL